MSVELSDQIKNKVERRTWRRLLVHILILRSSGSPHFLEPQYPQSRSQDPAIHLKARVPNLLPQIYNLLF
jgi:hypothetical protein